MAATQGDFYCETCDRSWNTPEKLEEHVSQHEVCGRDGCLFTGHPKVVQKHVELQHDTGLYKRILNDNPNDIAKWIAERKSRFPTKENVQKKEAQEKEMMNRGESIPSQGKRFPNRKSWNNRGRNMNHSASSLNRGGGGPRQSRPAPKHVKTDSDSKWRDPDTWRGDLPKFPGTAAVTLSEEENEKNSKENGNFSDDEEWTVKAVDNPTPSNADKPIVSNVLTLLMSSYGSDMSEEDDDGATEGSSRIESVLSLNDVKEKSDPSTSQNGRESLVKSKSEKDLADRTSEMDQDSDSGPEESAIEREDKSNIPFICQSEKECTSQLDNTNSRQPSSRPKAPPMRPVTRRYQLSLLEKLLSSEIRKERNAILQCVRYVVTNDFFGCGNLGKATVNS